MIVVSGYYLYPGSVEQFKRWCDNTRQYAERYIVAADAHCPFDPGNLRWVHLSGNIGHNGKGTQKGKLSGWTHSFLTGCLLAYGCGKDMLYQEGDCLAFGPYLERLNREIGQRGLICGHVNTSGNSVGGNAAGLTAQSLVLVRNWYLLEFIEKYLQMRQSDVQLEPEHKFRLIGESNGKHVSTGMGYDRSRPIGYDDPEFYVQQCSDSELHELRKRGLI